MQASALALNEERRDRSGYNVESHTNTESQRKEPKFFKEMQKKAYLESDMTLEDRMNRNKHYRDRRMLREDE